MITHDFAVSIDLSFEYKQNAESISVYIGRHMYAFKDKPIVAWSDRPRQRVYESDLRANYYMLKPYLLVCGNKTPLPDLVHHEVCGFHDVRMYRLKISILNNYSYMYMNYHFQLQAAFVLISCTYNLHATLYGRRGGRGLLRVTCQQLYR